ncbi:unnamed protein product [Rotaria sordida]|uniref:Palmitoyltransferase n=1 Tax=Rotaria sordida TaxID=392033 RepID=A0A819DUT6_9BILA|nr:unnamed protein product [Rotaria sordida]CAF3839546.1 unnamed protein product [Rotaria sordida]
MTCYTDPGYVPYKRIPNWTGGMMSTSDDDDENEGNRQQPVTTSNNYLRKCLLCNIEQPLRSHHCDFCNRCVLKYDHHCPYLETCIGEYNHCYFWCFLLTTDILIVWSIMLCSGSFVPFSDWSSWLHINKFRLFAMHVLIISLCATTILLCIHSVFALTNSTTWERVSRHRITYLNRLPNEDLNPFHQGYCHNFFYSFLCRRIKEQQWDIVYKKRVEEHVTLYIPTIVNQTEEKIVSNGVNHDAPIATKDFAVDSASSSFKLFDSERGVPKNLEQHCPDTISTNNSTELHKSYSNFITIKKHFACKISKNLPLDTVTPLLCASITTYSPLKQYHVGINTRMRVISLGHMAVKFGVAMGTHVTVIPTSESKYDDVIKFDAKAFLVSKDVEQLKGVENSFNFIIYTVVSMIKIGAPPKLVEIPALILLFKQLIITGSQIGRMKQKKKISIAYL